MASKKNTRKAVRSTATTKKSAPKRSVTPRRSVSSAATPIVEERTTDRGTSRSLPKVNKWVPIVVLSAVLLLGLLYLLRSLFVAALVNGQPISRLSVISELEKQSGKQALDTLVTKSLIMQEARKQNVTINQDEINSELKKIENNVKQQGQTLDQALALQGMTRDGLMDQIRIQKTVEKILGKQIQVTDKEVNDYITTNKEALGENPESQENKTRVKEQLTQQKLSEKFQSWLQGLQKNAKINYFVNY